MVIVKIVLLVLGHQIPVYEKMGTSLAKNSEWDYGLRLGGPAFIPKRGKGWGLRECVCELRMCDRSDRSDNGFAVNIFGVCPVGIGIELP